MSGFSVSPASGHDVVDSAVWDVHGVVDVVGGGCDVCVFVVG